MPLIYVFASSNMEARPVLALARRNVIARQGRPTMVEVGENRFTVIVTGMGAGNARTHADRLLNADGARGVTEKPDASLVIGFCGGLTEAMYGGRVVAYTECLSAEKEPPLPCSPGLTSSVIESLQKGGITCDRVVGVTSPRIACNRSEKLPLARAGASVVDMETYQVLSAAQRASVPAAVLRVVVDPLDTNIPNFNSALDVNGGLAAGKAFWIALRSPFETGRLLAASKRAIDRLAPAIKLVLESNCFSI